MNFLVEIREASITIDVMKVKPSKKDTPRYIAGVCKYYLSHNLSQKGFNKVYPILANAVVNHAIGQGLRATEVIDVVALQRKGLSYRAIVERFLGGSDE